MFSRMNDPDAMVCGDPFIPDLNVSENVIHLIHILELMLTWPFVGLGMGTRAYHLGEYCDISPLKPYKC